MDLDPLSIVAPARVKVLLLPLGCVRRLRFEAFVERLQYANVVRLGDVSPDSRPHRTMFSPLAFPEGLVLYDLATTLPPPSHLALAPFEIYREPLVIVGIADGKRLEVDGVKGRNSEGHANAGAGTDGHANNGYTLDSLSRDLTVLQQEYPRALLHRILVFDHDSSSLPKEIYPVPPPEKSRTTTVKTVMCDLTSGLLAEMTTFAKSLQNLPSLDTPKVPSGSAALNGIASSLPAHMAGLPRSASVIENSRSYSPIDDRPGAGHRMSTPATVPIRPGSQIPTPDSRVTSPPSGAQSPPTTFNEINGTSATQSPPKPSSHGNSRAGSRDRVSVNGLGTNSLGERERIKAKSRVGVVVGAMYLLAGRWPDAVKELVQSATIARSNSDYVWYAKAMDYILVCLLMYAWAGMDFRIPDIIFPNLDRTTTGSSKSSNHAPSNSLPDLSGRKSLDPADRAANLRTFTSLLPDLTNNILNLYSRAWTFTDDKIPPLAFCESAIRFTKLLSSIHLCSSTLDDVLLRHLVLNAETPPAGESSSEPSPFMAKGELVNLLFRAYPRPLSESAMSIAEHTAILAAIASILSQLGYDRKKALVLKDLMSGLLPALVQARKDGAAEMGVHPAANLANLNATVRAIPLESAGLAPDDSEQGMRHLLSLVCYAYGIRPAASTRERSPMKSPTWTRIRLESSSTANNTQLNDAVVARVIEQASAKSYGSQDLKIDILRACINLCEALPDLSGALRYSAELLRVAGSCIAPGPEDSDGSPDLPLEEQVRLANNISRTLSAARQLGLEHPEADYWDEFLVRGIELMDANPSKCLLPHASSELAIVETLETSKEKNPFIYNPFLKSKTGTTPKSLLVAQEESFFRVTLQNLYDFELAIERLKLESDGVPFEGSIQATTIGPYRTQTLLLSGTPKSAGSLSISGCIAKIKGCRERSFVTFGDPWALKYDVKGRHVGLRDKLRPLSAASDTGKTKPYRSTGVPTPSILALNVINTQPNIFMKSISLPQSAIMLLEGETKRFSITLQNLSSTTAADLLLLSFDDSTASHRHSLPSDKELSPFELYELELDLAHNPSFRWARNDDDDFQLNPGQEKTLEVEIRGKPRLSYGTIQVDYGYLSIPKADVKDRFYTRQLVIPITVTVNASIDLVRNDVVTFPGNLSLKQLDPTPEPHEIKKAGSALPSAHTSPLDPDHLQPILNLISPSASTSSLCLLLLDFRNSWPNSISITISLCNPDSQDSPLFADTLSLSPGTTRRVSLPIPRLYLPNMHSPIPSLNPANKRQFVVSATKSSPEVERALREEFWYREALLERVGATWRDEITGRHGNVELRGLRFTPRMIEAIRLKELDVEMAVVAANNDGAGNERTVTELAPSKFSVPTSTFVTLRITLYNRSSDPLEPFLRMQPALVSEPHNIALDLSKRLLVNGILQRALPTLEPGKTQEIATSFCVLSPGIYEWNAIVEEVRAKNQAPKTVNSRARAQTGDRDLLGRVGRRIWHGEDRCVVVVGGGGGGERGDSDGL